MIPSTTAESQALQSHEVTESVACPYCHQQSGVLVSATDRNRQTTDTTFHYYQCGGCGLVFMDPIPSDLAPFYRGGYQTIPASLSGLREIAARERYRMEPILKYKKSGKMLEIGPWMGIFSCNAKDAGFDVTAIEMDQSCVDFLNHTVGINAQQSFDPAESIAKLDEQFDVIALWHTLEHLRRPWLVIEQAAKRLARSGILVVAIPNIESYQFQTLKARWRHLDAPRHLFFYPAESLESLCRSFGLTTLEMTTSDVLSDELSEDAWRHHANSIVSARYPSALLARGYRYASRRKERKPRGGAGLTAVFQRPLEK